MQFWTASKTLTPLAATALSWMCVLVQQPLDARRVDIEQEQPAHTQAEPATSALTFSGFVRRDHDGVADVRLRLRDVDRGSVVGETVSGPDGAFSFPIPGPGLYVVEAIQSDGKVKAVSPLSRINTSAVVNDVILPSPRALFWIATSAFVLTAAGDSGVLPWEGGNRLTPTPTVRSTVASPER